MSEATPPGNANLPIGSSPLDPVKLAALAAEVQSAQRVVDGLSDVAAKARGVLADANAANTKILREFSAARAQSVSAPHRQHAAAVEGLETATATLAAARKAMDDYIAGGK